MERNFVPKVPIKRLLLKHRRLPGRLAVTRAVPSQAHLLTTTLGVSPPLSQGASRKHRGWP